jgi:DNA-binding transcriptional MerR regulator
MRISEIVREMSPPRYTTSQAAELVGKHEDTIKRWRDHGVYVPSDKRVFGTTEVPLYTSEDIRAMKEIAKTIRPGRKKATA